MPLNSAASWLVFHTQLDRTAISAYENFSELLLILRFAFKRVTTGRPIWSKSKRNLNGGSSRSQVIAMTKIFIFIVVWDTRVPIGYLYANCWLCILRLWCNSADLDMKLFLTTSPVLACLTFFLIKPNLSILFKSLKPRYLYGTKFNNVETWRAINQNVIILMKKTERVYFGTTTILMMK
jgi:hypothetical protein